jgi:hypothetical protein
VPHIFGVATPWHIVPGQSRHKELETAICCITSLRACLKHRN